MIKAGEKYSIFYTGTPPGNQRYKLSSKSKGVTISIKYPKAGAY